MRIHPSIVALGALVMAACSTGQHVADENRYGASPELPKPASGLIPTVKIAKVTGWPDGETPVAAPGFRVAAFATGLQHPRWIYVLPNGDVLVAETDSPPSPPTPGIRGFFERLLMRQAGAKTPSANRITLLRDADGDGVVETRTVFLQGLFSPFGMALVGNDFYVANADAVVRYPYEPGRTAITAPGVRLTALPSRINHHWTKSLLASPDGSRLYVGVGSNSNVGENGIEAEAERAAVWEIDRVTGEHRVFASGIRNPVGIAWQPQSGALWVSVNERDELGDDLVPDYMTSVRDGGFYGWPYSYYGQHVDTRVKPQRPDLVASAIVPDYALGAHTASLGLMFYTGALFSETYRNGAFIGQHGSWNRSIAAGYKVAFVPFVDGKPSGRPQDFLTGFLVNGQARGRPVGVAQDKTGALLVADDVGNVIWRVTPAPAPR